MKLCALLAALCCALSLAAADNLTASQAKDHIGETATVCGKVAGTRYLETSNRKPTFLNFDKAYPNHPFLAIIFGENRIKFGKPEEEYLEKDVCVTGKIIDFQGKPEMELTEPGQIKSASK